jgi:DNA repair exonuclease SbcCD ATPase subunit
MSYMFSGLNSWRSNLDSLSYEDLDGQSFANKTHLSNTLTKFECSTKDGDLSKAVNNLEGSKGQLRAAEIKYENDNDNDNEALELQLEDFESLRELYITQNDSNIEALNQLESNTDSLEYYSQVEKVRYDIGVQKYTATTPDGRSFIFYMNEERGTVAMTNFVNSTMANRIISELSSIQIDEDQNLLHLEDGVMEFISSDYKAVLADFRESEQPETDDLYLAEAKHLMGHVANKYYHLKPGNKEDRDLIGSDSDLSDALFAFGAQALSEDYAKYFVPLVKLAAVESKILKLKNIAEAYFRKKETRSEEQQQIINSISSGISSLETDIERLNGQKDSCDWAQEKYHNGQKIAEVLASKIQVSDMLVCTEGMILGRIRNSDSEQSNVYSSQRNGDAPETVIFGLGNVNGKNVTRI